MRQAGTIDNLQDAERFVAYLVTLGIGAQADSDGQEYAIWVYDEDHIDRAKGELSAYLENPKESRYVEAVKEADKIIHQQVTEQIARKKKQVDVSARWNRHPIHSMPGTLALIAISILITLLSSFGEGDLAQFFWIEPHVLPTFKLDAVQKGEIWRLVTPIFMHLGFMHILFNMWWLHDFGRMIENRRGTWRFLALVLVLAVASNIGQYWWTVKPGFGGMSGVVYGLFGYIWMKTKSDPGGGFFIHQQTVLILMGWFFLCWLGWVGSIANHAHAVGLIVGMAIGSIPPPRR